MSLIYLKAAGAALVTILFVAALPDATTATEEKAKPGAEAATSAPEFTDARLRAFAIASNAIFAIRQKYLPQVQAAGSEDEARKLATAAQQEMLKVVADNGLTVDQYNAVVAAAQNDPSLIDRIKTIEKSIPPKN